MIRREALLWLSGTVASAGFGTSLKPALQDLQEQQDINSLITLLKPQVAEAESLVYSNQGNESFVFQARRLNESYRDLYSDLDRVNSRIISRFLVSATELLVVWIASACIRSSYPQRTQG